MEIWGFQPTAAALKTKQVTNHSHDSDVRNITTSFAEMLNDALTSVEQQEKQVQALNMQFMAGQPVDVHDIMIAAEKAQLGLQLTVQVRNKVVEAYQEIMRIQL